MDVLGTKRLVGVIEKALGVTLPKADADLEKLGADLDAAGVFLAEGTDLIRDMDKIAEAWPEQQRALVVAVLGLVSHFLRVGTRASNAAQAGEAAAKELTGLIQDVRREGLGALIPRQK